MTGEFCSGAAPPNFIKKAANSPQNRVCPMSYSDELPMSSSHELRGMNAIIYFIIQEVIKIG